MYDGREGRGGRGGALFFSLGLFRFFSASLFSFHSSSNRNPCSCSHTVSLLSHSLFSLTLTTHHTHTHSARALCFLRQLCARVLNLPSLNKIELSEITETSHDFSPLHVLGYTASSLVFSCLSLIHASGRVRLELAVMGAMVCAVALWRFCLILPFPVDVVCVSQSKQGSSPDSSNRQGEEFFSALQKLLSRSPSVVSFRYTGIFYFFVMICRSDFSFSFSCIVLYCIVCVF